MPERGQRRLARGQASDTAEVNAAMRAVEGTRPANRRLFDDPYAHHFVRRPLYRALTRLAPVGRLASVLLDRWMPGLTGEVILRNRYWDDALDEALAAGVRQVVLLGAGYDSTALRRELGADVTVYEVDSPPTQEAKRAALERAGLAPRVEFVPCDFEVHAVGERLVAAGFDRSERAAICWLGVSPYLTAAGLRGALDDLAALSAPGSRLVMDYIDEGVTAGTTPYRGGARAARSVERRGEPYRSGFDEAGFARLLGAAGFDVTDHARVEDLAERYLGGEAWCRSDDWLRVATAVRRD